MNEIICATRGGQGSRAVRTRAITLAQETGLPLLFLFIVDLSHFSGHDNILTEALQQEAYWLGRVMLEIARQQAQSAGLQAEVVICEGIMREELVRVLWQRRANRLLLGAPRRASVSVFGDDAIEQFAQEIGQETGIPVEIVHPENTP